jgi:hypothetical protein
MKRLVPSLFVAAMAVLPAVGLAASTAPAPRACQLLTKQLVEDYFHTDMVKTADKPEACDWQSRIRNTHKGSSLLLVTWRLPSNARSAIAAACRPRRGVHQLRLAGADKACGAEGPTGLCVDPPKGEDPRDWCQWDVRISFLRGATTGSLELAALRIYSLNDLAHGTRFAQGVLKRWK